MNAKNIIVASILLLLGASATLAAQTKAESKEQARIEQAAWIKQSLEDKDFRIEVSQALPQSGRSVNLTSSYSISLKDDVVISQLPYYGRAYSVPYGGGEGLNFKAEYTDYSLAYDAKGMATIQLKARTKEDSYTIRLRIYPNGKSYVYVESVNRQSISFNGELEK